MHQHRVSSFLGMVPVAASTRLTCAPVLTAANDEGWAVGRVVQPYRLAGRRAPTPARQLDAAWLTAVAAIRRRRGLGEVPLVVGGRSSGARVACRTALETGAAAVIALAFPLRAPGRVGVDRGDELAGAGVPALVVQGDRDPFGSSEDIAALRLERVDVCGVPGADHALRTPSATDAVIAAVAELLRRLSC